MIKNNRQLKYTQKRLRELEKNLEGMCKKYGRDRRKVGLLGQGYKEHITQLKAEIAEFEKMKKTPLPKILWVHDLDEISHQLVRLRVARKLTQAQLAARIGCKQSDISRLEREEYSGYTLEQLKKIVTSLNAGLEIALVPRTSRKRVNSGHIPFSKTKKGEKGVKKGEKGVKKGEKGVKS